MSSAPALPEPLVRDLERRVRSAQREWRVPGVSAGVVREGRLVWSTHVGSARLDPAKPGTDDTQFMIGSITKTFTALLVLMLRDEGKLDLDAPLGTWLPRTKHAPVTVRQMLAHASGLQREPAGYLWESLEAPDAARLRRELDEAERVLGPHVAFHYSNLAYALLGQVVEEVEGPWEKVVTQRILKPLGMSRTGLTPAKDRAIGYQVHPFAGTATQEPVFDLKATAPLGGLWSTIADLARYAAFVADPDPAVLAPETVAEMCRPLIMVDTDAWTRAYGLGFDTTRRGERLLVGHGGAMPGFLTGLKVHRADKVGAVVSANGSSRAEPSTLAADLAVAVLDALPALPEPWVPERRDEDLEELLGIWWSEGEELRLEVREGDLWMVVPGGGPLGETRFVRESDVAFRAVEGRERGELLEIVRDEEGDLRKLYFATYAVTRAPLAFADL
ncbi:serine hydrolase domain-containing protein [Lapillicoccus jejuensis]|uniref:CubicO group peptidase (Beta-lactamase class C family) n=1 Tax=Lapillicoccus jejuensis TaxID=402171 RepID=A0A542E5Q7_9MICO|nr:serine hydrolase domain-containing protein [Lapillicoccus jejuensis]TQJ10675.1 CubicO group peptidase (beta-lactamase class C family) [Lapillicoccus jejuensis]